MKSGPGSGPATAARARRRHNRGRRPRPIPQPCGSLNLNLHSQVIAIEGVFVNRTNQGLKPRFLKGEPPSDADIDGVVQKISRRVIRKLRQRGYLEARMEAPVATGYAPLLDT